MDDIDDIDDIVVMFDIKSKWFRSFCMEVITSDFDVSTGASYLKDNYYSTKMITRQTDVSFCFDTEDDRIMFKLKTGQ